MKVTDFPDFMARISLDECLRFEETDMFNLLLEPDDGNNSFARNAFKISPE